MGGPAVLNNWVPTSKSRCMVLITDVLAVCMRCICGRKWSSCWLASRHVCSRAQVYARPGPLTREQGNRAGRVAQPQLRVGGHVGP